jgi:hypothetical protein
LGILMCPLVSYAPLPGLVVPDGTGPLACGYVVPPTGFEPAPPA